MTDTPLKPVAWIRPRAIVAISHTGTALTYMQNEPDEFCSLAIYTQDQLDAAVRAARNETLDELRTISETYCYAPGIKMTTSIAATLARLTAENEKLRSRSITLRTERNGSTAGQRIIVSVHDGEHEWDVIEEFGALPDISIHHSVTPFGIEERRAKSIVGETARTALEQP